MPSEPQPYQALITSKRQLVDLAALLASDDAPIAIDAERASGYRYYQRAYLLQLHHPEHGTWLIDPIEASELSPLTESLRNREWVIHAATQDLPCLKELGMSPDRLFDTELAGRLLGMPRVALAVMLEEFVGIRLAKQHSAADWSKRPLPQTWLEYAALDVAYLVTLRERVAEALAAEKKLTWAQQEFDSLCSFEPAAKKDEPWRRLSGIHFVTNDRARAVAKSLWTSREQIAEQTDTAPGRLLSDSAIMAAANAMPGNVQALSALREFQNKSAQERIATWWSAIEQALAEPIDQLPTRHPQKSTSATRARSTQPPKINAKTDPAAAERLGSARTALREISDQVNVPPENLLPAAALRAAVWLPPKTLDILRLQATLTHHGARPWQVDLTSQALLEALENPKLLASRVITSSESQPNTDHQPLGPA